MIKLNFDFKLISKDNEKIMGRNGRFFLSKRFKEFEELIRMIASFQYKGEPLEKDVSLVLVANFSSKVHSDCTNLFKGVCDALQGICYKNDRQIKHAECMLYENSDENNFTVILESLEDKDGCNSL